MSAPLDLDGHDAAQAAPLRDLLGLLRRELDAALPEARAKVWHGSPVWFDGENPVAGYSVRKGRVEVLFWNGKAFEAPGLTPVGKHFAARVDYAGVADVDLARLRAWLAEARVRVFDGVTYFAALREAARREKAAATSSAAPSAAKAPRRARR
jgi:hypothetical protein